MKITFRLLTPFLLKRRRPGPSITKVEPALAPVQEDPGTWLAPSMATVMSMRWRIIELGEKLDQARHRLALAYNYDEAKSARIEELEAELAKIKKEAAMQTEFMLLAIYNKPRLSLDEICQALGMSTATGYTHRSPCKFPVAMSGSPLSADICAGQVARGYGSVRQQGRDRTSGSGV